MKIWIPGEFTTANQYIAATNANRYKGAQIKKVETNRVMWECRSLDGIVDYPVSIKFTWIRKNRKSDPDNIAFAVKFILDGLQQAGILHQDTWFAIKRISHEFKVDKYNSGVEVEIT